MIRFILILLTIIAVLIGGVIAAVHFIPSSVYKEKIETAAETALGRDVIINGDVKIRLFPKIAASAGQTIIANPEGFGDSDFASMSELRAAVKILPLLSQKVEIDEFILVDPKLSLVKLENGQNNWTFAPASKPKPETESPDTPDQPANVDAGLGDVRLVNGYVSFDDRQAKQKHVLSDLDILVKLPKINGPLKIDGDGIIDDLAFDLNADIANLQKLLGGLSTAIKADLKTDLASTGLDGNVVMGDVIGLELKANADVSDLQALANFMKVELPGAAALGKAKLSAQIGGQVGALKLSDVVFSHDSDLLNIGFNGAANVGDKIAFQGDLNLDAPNLRALAQSADVALPAGDVYKHFSLTGSTNGSLESVALTNAKLVFDDIKGDGDMRLSLAGSKPKLTGNLSTNVLNVTKYAAASGAANEKPKSNNGGSWEDTALDLSPLKAVDVDLQIQAEGLKFQGIDIGKTSLNTTIIDGRLVADLTETSLYGGKGSAKIVADASSSTPKIEMLANLNALNAAPFLGAVAGFDKVEGVGGLNISLNGSGSTMGNIMSSLSGGGKFKFDDGVVKGINTEKLMKSATEFLNTGTIPSAMSADEETSFKEFAANFAIQKGVASTKDFNFEAAGFKIPGRGELDLGNRTLSLSMFPESDDKSVGINGFAPPIKIAGGWNQLSVGLDQEWLQQKLTQQLQDEAQDLIAKELGLGGSSGDILGSGEDADKARRDVLGNVLGDALGINKDKAEEAAEESSTDTTEQDSKTSNEEAPEEEEKSLEEQLEDEAKKQILDLFK